MRLFPTDDGHSEIAFTGFYDLVLSQKIAALAENVSAGLMVDVGANYGYFALLWASRSSDHRVVAFEASPRNQQPLRDNAVLNHLEGQIEVRAFAVGHDAGVLQFSLGGDDQTGWGSFALAGSTQVTQVPVVTLDMEFPGDDPVELLKIDAEGADTWVLEGARSLLERQRIRHIFFELNKERMSALGIAETSPLDLLVGFGYQVTALTDPAAELVEYYATASKRVPPNDSRA